MMVTGGMQKKKCQGKITKNAKLKSNNNNKKIGKEGMIRMMMLAM